MNKNETNHLSAFHPFNQLNFSNNNVPLLQTALPNSSMILPQFNAQNLLNCIESSAVKNNNNNNDLTNLIQNKNFNFQHNKQEEESFNSFSTVIVKPKIPTPTKNSNNNFDQYLYPLINNKREETVPLTTYIKFPNNYNVTTNVDKTNIETDAIIQHADSSSSNYSINYENFLSIKEKQLGNFFFN